MVSLQAIPRRLFGTADCLKLSGIAVALDLLAWVMLLVGLANDRLGVLAGFATIGILGLTFGVGLLILPLSVVDLAKGDARHRGLMALLLCLAVLVLNIFSLARWDL